MNKEKLTDKALRQAAAAWREAMLRDLPSPQECERDFSPEFEEKMALLLARARRKARRRQQTQRVAAVFLVLLLGSGLWLGLDGDARASFVAWFRKPHEDGVEYQFSGEKPDAPLPLYEPTWVPEGYEKTREDYDDSTYTAVFCSTDDPDKNFIFDYHYMTLGGLLMVFDEEDECSEELFTIHGMTAHFYQSSEPNKFIHLLWFDEDKNIVFTIESSLERSVILRIAESVKLSEMTN